jgi:acetyltransferase-like isoleucine patch superfamily enzyme
MNPGDPARVASRYRKLWAADKTHVMRIALSYVRGFVWAYFFRLIGKRITIGKSLQLFGFPRLAYTTGQISLGSNLTMGRQVLISVAPNSRLSIGHNSGMNDYSRIVSNYGCFIGNNVMIGELVSIRDFDHVIDQLEIPMGTQGFVGAPVVVEDDVWIGRGVAILKGVRIGKGAVIGANAVVNRDIPPYSIAVGVPARVVKIRNPH